MSRSGRNGWFSGLTVGAIACVAMPLSGLQARGETLESALVQAYQNNPTLNSQRAAMRATDENVPQALSGYRPRVSVTASGGQNSLSTTSKVAGANVPINTPATYFTQSGYNTAYGAGITATQTIFNGFQTANRTRQAEAQVLAARESLRLSEQSTLLNAATAYMNVLRDGALLNLQKRNVQVLEETLRYTRDKFNVGEVTITDVAQAESRLAAGRSSVLSAEATYKASVATYRQIIGNEPGKLTSGMPVDRFSPRTLTEAVGVAIAVNPSVTAAQYNVDIAQMQVKVAEGALYPTLSVQGNFQKNFMSAQNLNAIESYNASLLGTLSVPLYQGGAEYSAIRQAKETLGQKRIDLDTARESVRQSVVAAWGQLEAAKGQIESTQSQVKASELALKGVTEEARVGQRTTLDVLNAQQDLLNAQVSLVTAQRDRVVASYSLLSAVGRLGPRVLGLRVPLYDATVHYQQVRDSWAGVRTPDGR
jgi:outer membrane protein